MPPAPLSVVVWTYGPLEAMVLGAAGVMALCFTHEMLKLSRRNGSILELSVGQVRVLRQLVHRGLLY